MQKVSITALVLTGILFTSVKYIPPNYFYYLSLLQPIFIFYFIALFGLGVIGMIKKLKSISILTFLFIIINWSHAKEYIPAFKSNDSVSAADFSVLSYNISFLFSGPIHKQYAERGKLIMNWLTTQNHDIVCLQEFFIDSGYHADMKSLIRKYPYQYSLMVPMISASGRGGLSIFSKYEIINSGVIFQETEWKKYNGAIFIDIKVEEKNVRIINAHLHSMGFYNPFIQDDILKHIRHNLNSLRVGSKIRNRQIRSLLDFTSQTNIPTIICVDMNESAHSYFYSLFKRNFLDSFQESGSGFGFTLNKIFLKHLRIDFQFHTPDLKSVDFSSKFGANHSHHLPISGTYEIY
jgi:endonuclease/exonuclease/phosphatase family metal-dependent hydrolase